MTQLDRVGRGVARIADVEPAPVHLEGPRQADSQGDDELGRAARPPAALIVAVKTQAVAP